VALDEGVVAPSSYVQHRDYQRWGVRIERMTTVLGSNAVSALA
jgi:hypothetical protein